MITGRSPTTQTVIGRLVRDWLENCSISLPIEDGQARQDHDIVDRQADQEGDKIPRADEQDGVEQDEEEVVHLSRLSDALGSWWAEEDAGPSRVIG